MKISFLPYPRLFENEKGEFLYEMQRVLDSGQFILGPEVEKFEKSLAEYIGTKYAVGVNSGTDALFLALKAAGIGPGDEVITVSHTFVATIQTIKQTGATPILVDIGDDGLMDMEQVEKAITDKTRAIVPVHLEGKVCDLKTLNDIADRNNLTIIEDACQAFGAKYGESKAGSFGLAGCFSFYPAKIMGVPGDAGAITTNDEDLYNELKLLRNHYGIGKGVEGKVKFGYNSRLDNLQAAFLNVKFKYRDEILNRRRDIAERYISLIIENFPGLKIAHNQPGRVWQDYVIRCKDQEERDQLVQWLNNAGIGVLGHDLKPNHLYDGLDLNFDLPKTVEYINTQIRLPCNTIISDEEVDYIINTIKEFYGNK